MESMAVINKKAPNSSCFVLSIAVKRLLKLSHANVVVGPA
jgi:hypothetical protein